MKPVCSHNHYHLGDCLISAHLLRSLAKGNPDRQFWFFISEGYLPQMNEVVEDLPNLSLFSFNSDQWQHEKGRSVNMWKDFRDHWNTSPMRWNWVDYTLEHHRWTAWRMGFPPQFSVVTELLFDYPALGPSVEKRPRWAAEFFISNSDPGSGQITHMQGENSGYLDDLIWKLSQHHSTMTTQPVKGSPCTRSMGHTVSLIGRCSVAYEHHILVPSGPFWPTLNVHNHHLWGPDRKRIVIIDNGEDLTGIPWLQQVSRVEEAYDILRHANLI